MTRCRRISRRGILALSAGPFLAPAASAAAVRHTGEGRKSIRSCIILFFYGGPSHIETWDPKPEAPAEIRGEFRAIDTAAPGVRIAEHLPLTARVMRDVALVRSMHHPMRNHNSAAVEALCGRTPLGGDLELLADDSLSFPCFGSSLAYADPSAGVLPAVALPHVMYNVVRLPGQTAGFLGAQYAPFQVESEPNSDAFSPGELDPHRLLGPDRLLRRRDLLARSGGAGASSQSLPPYDRAFDLLAAEEIRKAFRIQAETAPMRDRYGRNRLGQSLLLARRLVEGGVRFITVFDGIHNGQEANWDSHVAIFPRHRDHLLPPADRGFSTLVADLRDRGLLESTLVVALGEFGRTPRINSSAGRDHWPDCFSIALAGGGVRGGCVLGASDAEGAYPADDPATPGDLAATLFWRFGLDWRQEIRDATGRPYPLANGRPLTALF